MLSVLNTCTLHTFRGVSCIRSKASYFKEKLPWVDVVIGIILCIIGPLALQGTLLIPGGDWITSIGALEVGLGFVMKYYSSCKERVLYC